MLNGSKRKPDTQPSPSHFSVATYNLFYHYVPIIHQDRIDSVLYLRDVSYCKKPRLRSLLTSNILIRLRLDTPYSVRVHNPALAKSSISRVGVWLKSSKVDCQNKCGVRTSQEVQDRGFIANAGLPTMEDNWGKLVFYNLIWK